VGFDDVYIQLRNKEIKREMDRHRTNGEILCCDTDGLNLVSARKSLTLNLALN
jgi:hypothetical protein